MATKQELTESIKKMIAVANNPKTKENIRKILLNSIEKAENQLKDLEKAETLEKKEEELTEKQEKKVEETKTEAKELVKSLKSKISSAKKSVAKSPAKSQPKGSKSISKARELARKYRMAQKGVPTGESDIERDAGRPALPKGKRIAKKSGKKYYENRENRIDRKQPPKNYPKLAEGGKIKDQYEGREAKDIWNNLSKLQRQHFIYDHKDEIEAYRGEEYGQLNSQEIIKAYNSDWDKLDKNIANRFSNHVREGQYDYGGILLDSDLQSFDIYNLDDFEYMQYTHLTEKSGLSKEKALLVLINNVEGDYSQLSPKLRAIAKRHKMADGGKMASGGTMAKGGSVKPLSYYVYETAKITINWRGKTQPYGRFKSAEDALNQIKKIARTNSELSEYSIVTPDGTLNVSEYMASGGKMEYGGILLPMTGGVNADPRFDIYNTGAFMKDGGEVAIPNSKIIGKTISVLLPTELKPFKDKVVEEYKDFVVGKKGIWSKKYIMNKNAMRFEDGGMNEGGDNEYLIMYRSDNPTYQNEDGFEGNPPDSMFADSPFEVIEYLKENMPDDVELVSIEEASEMSMMKRGGYNKKEYGGILQPMTGGVNADPRFDIYNTGAFMKDGGMMAMGGATEHGLKEGDEIFVAQENALVVYNRITGETAIINIETGKREDASYLKDQIGLMRYFSRGNDKMSEGGEVRWQDAQRGDSALVKAENKLGVIMKAYGRKFHLKFVDGTEKTYDANDLKFISSDDFAEGGLMKDFNKNFTTAYILQQQLAEKEKESQGVPSDVTTDYNYETTYYNEKYYPSRSHDGEKFASKELYNALRDGSGNLKGSNEKDIESEITSYFDENMVKTISGKDLHKMWKEGKGMNVEKKKKGWFGFKEGGQVSLEKMYDELRMTSIRVRLKIASLIGVDEATQYLNKDLVVNPISLIESAVRKGLITIDEINKNLWDSAISKSESIESTYRDSGEGIGSSDMNAFISSMLNDAGIKVGVKDNTYQRMADGGKIKKMKVDVTKYKKEAEQQALETIKTYGIEKTKRMVSDVINELSSDGDAINNTYQILYYSYFLKFVKEEGGKIASGGMMEKGGEIQVGDLVKVKKYGWVMKVDKVEDDLYYLENDKIGKSISGKLGNPGSYSKSQLEKIDKDNYAKGGRLTNQEKLREEIYYLIHYMLVDRKFRINDLEKVKEGISKYGNKEQKELAKKITTPSFGKNEQLEEVLFKLKYSLPKETMASGGKVKFSDKVASIKKSLLERKKVPKAVQKDYGKTFSPSEAEDSAKRIVGSQVYAERIKKFAKKRKK